MVANVSDEVSKIREHYYASDASWWRGFRWGLFWGLGLTYFSIAFIGWLSLRG